MVREFIQNILIRLMGDSVVSQTEIDTYKMEIEHRQDVIFQYFEKQISDLKIKNNSSGCGGCGGNCGNSKE